jgi:hypothetical protein
MTRVLLIRGPTAEARAIQCVIRFVSPLRKDRDQVLGPIRHAPFSDSFISANIMITWFLIHSSCSWQSSPWLS